MDNLKAYLEIFQEIKAIKNYIRYLEGKKDLLEAKIIKSGQNIPRRIDNYFLKLKVVPKIKILLGDTKKQELFRLIDERVPGAAKLTIHPLSLAKYYDMGILDDLPELKKGVNYQKTERIVVNYVSDAEGEEIEESILRAKNLIPA